MMSRHFALNSEITGAIVKILPHAKNQLSSPCSFFNQFVTDIYIDHHLVITPSLLIKYKFGDFCAISITSALRLLAQRGWRTLCVRRRRPFGGRGHID